MFCCTYGLFFEKKEKEDTAMDISSRMNADQAYHETYQKLFKEYNKKISKIAGRILRSMNWPEHMVEHQDLKNVGMMGLVQAYENYDIEKGIAFSTYADYRIKGAMLDELREVDKVPGSVRKIYKNLNETVHMLEVRLTRMPSDEEIAYYLNISLAQLDEWRILVNGISDKTVVSLHDAEILLTVDDNEDRMAQKEAIERILHAVEQLPDVQAIVVKLYYLEELSLKEVGKKIGYSESNVCLILAKAMKTLKKRAHLERWTE